MGQTTSAAAVKASNDEVLDMARRGAVSELTAQFPHFQEILTLKDARGNNLLHYAVASRSVAAVKAVLSHRHGPNLTTSANNTADYAIHSAARNHDLAIIELIVNASRFTDPNGNVRSVCNVVDGGMNQPLHIALMPVQPKPEENAFGTAPGPSAALNPPFVKPATAPAATASGAATATGATAAVASASAPASGDSKSQPAAAATTAAPVPIASAVPAAASAAPAATAAAPFKFDIAVIKYLASQVAAVCAQKGLATAHDTINSKNTRGWSPLLLAASAPPEWWNIQVDLVRLLITTGGASVHSNHKKTGETSLHLACLNDRLELAQALLHEFKASPNVTTRTGYTPLHLLCDKPNTAAAAAAAAAAANEKDGKDDKSSLVYMCIRAGALPDWRRGFNGHTPLHDAINHSNLSAVRALLTHSAAAASLSLKNDDGLTPIEYARAVSARDAKAATAPAAAAIEKEIAAAALVPAVTSVPVPKPLAVPFRLQAMKMRFDAMDPPLLQPKAPYLALCGDIGIAKTDLYREFIHAQSKVFERVFVIAGNHEYYGSEVGEANAAMHAACESDPLKRAVFVNQKSLLVNGVRVIGAVLWSAVGPTQSVVDEVSMKLSDYQRIKMYGSTRKEINEAAAAATAAATATAADAKSKPAATTAAAPDIKKSHEAPLSFTVADSNAIHTADVAFLRAEIEAAKKAGEPVVVLTHHSPVKCLGDSEAEFYGSGISTAFSTDMKSLFGSPVRAWVYGHTHWRNDVVVRGTRVISNPRGYQQERLAVYRNDFVLEITA